MTQKSKDSNVTEKHFEFLCDEVAFLRSDWQDFKLLYLEADNRDRLAVIAYSFFESHLNLLKGGIVTSIFRLMDPESKSNYSNLSFDYLLPTLGKNTTYGCTLGKLRELVKPLKQYRDKLISHSDLSVHEKNFLDEKGFSQEISNEDVENILEHMSDLVYEIHKHRNSPQQNLYRKARNTAPSQEFLDFLERVDGE